MPSPQDEKEAVKKHKHAWVIKSPVEEVCNCGKVLISEKEETRRVEEWENYFDLVLTTDSYRDYMEMKKAWKAGDDDKMQEILKRVNTRMVDTGAKDSWGEKVYDFPQALEKPHFPNPKTWGGYVIE